MRVVFERQDMMSPGLAFGVCISIEFTGLAVGVWNMGWLIGIGEKE